MVNEKAKLKEIADCIYNYSITKSYDSDGLFGGKMGVLLFLGYYYRYTGEGKYQIAFEKLLNEGCDRICQGLFLPTYCDGIAGVFYGLKHLEKKQMIDLDFSDAYSGYHKYLSNTMLRYAKKGNNDFLHGATGIGFCLLKDNELDTFDSVISFIDILDKSAIIIEKGIIKWGSETEQRDKYKFNISMSHGMSSLSIFLSHCKKNNIYSDKVEELLKGVINYILTQEMEYKKYGSYFPPTSIESIGNSSTKSRLAWCYGDLGIAMAIWQAGNILKNQEWKNKALEVFEFSATRLSLEDNFVVDAGLCHGTSGIAQIFRRMYFETGDDKFQLANDYWIKETLEMAKWENGLAGYKAWGSDEERKWSDDINLLEGITGIGLALLASIGDESYSDWDEVLLLS